MSSSTVQDGSRRALRGFRFRWCTICGLRIAAVALFAVAVAEDVELDGARAVAEDGRIAAKDACSDSADASLLQASVHEHQNLHRDQTEAGPVGLVSCVMSKCLGLMEREDWDVGCAQCLPAAASDKPLGPNQVPAGYVKDALGAGLSINSAGIHNYAAIWCDGKVDGCERKDNYWGRGSVSIMGWDNVQRMQRETVNKTWSGEWWRGAELGYLINSPYFWSSEKTRNEPAGLMLGITPKQHAAIRLLLEEAFSPGRKGSEKYRNFETTAESMVADFLQSRTEIDVPSDLLHLVYQLNSKLVFDREVTWAEAKDFIAMQSKVNTLSIVTQFIPMSMHRLFDSYKDKYSEYVEHFHPLVAARWPELAKEDCAPAKSCTMLMSQAIVDALAFAGGLSVPTDLAAGVAVLFSEHETNPFPARKIPEGAELRFWWETLRFFPAVVGFPHWETRPTCPGLTAEETQALNAPEGQQQPCPVKKRGWLDGGLITDYPRSNQYQGGKRVVPNMALAQQDPAKWGPLADRFLLRHLTDYIDNFIGFADFAVDDEVAGGRNNRVCPGKSLTLMLGEAFFKTFKKEEWAAESAGDIKFHGGPTWVNGFKLRKK